MHVLRFDPIFRRALWGGRRLETTLGKSLPAGDDYAESWEVVDHRADQSRVAQGPCVGRTLGALVREQGAQLLGRHHPCGGFPLLLKFLDVQHNLSVQVHPSDERAARLATADAGKTEAWYVVHAEPGSRMYVGLRSDVDRRGLERAIADRRVAECVAWFEPKVGDCVLVPAGTVHALGAGLVVAEIQQSSDTTFRLFDWDRVGPDGRPRTLHVEQALEAIDWGTGPVVPVVPQSTSPSHVSRLVTHETFVVDRWQLSAPQHLGGDERFHLVVPLAGRMRFEPDTTDAPSGLGDTLLVPAAVGSVRVDPLEPAMLLDMYLPD